MTSEERFENREWNEAAHAAKEGFNQLNDMDKKVIKDEPDRAAIHLRKAVGHFETAATHLAKADVGESQKGAVDKVNWGLKDLKDAVTDIENGDIDAAENHYDAALDKFGDADAIMN